MFNCSYIFFNMSIEVSRYITLIYPSMTRLLYQMPCGFLKNMWRSFYRHITIYHSRKWAFQALQQIALGYHYMLSQFFFQNTPHIWCIPQNLASSIIMEDDNKFKIYRDYTSPHLMLKDINKVYDISYTRWSRLQLDISLPQKYLCSSKNPPSNTKFLISRSWPPYLTQ